MQNSTLIFYGLDLYVLNKFFYHFAKTKFVADRSKLVENKGLYLSPWVVTSNGVSDFNFTDPNVIKEIQAEMYEIWFRFFRVIDNTPIPYNPNYKAWEWVEQQKTIQRTYSETIRSRIEELNRQNKSAGKWVAGSVALAALGKLTLDIALTFTGLGIGVGAAGATFKSAGAEFFVRFGAAMGKSYGCAIAETWSDAKSADIWFTIEATPKNLAQNMPGWVNDVYQEQLKRVKQNNNAKLNKVKESKSNSAPKPQAVKPPPVKPNMKPPPAGVKMKAFPGQRPGFGQPKAPPAPKAPPPPTTPKPSAASSPVSGGKLLTGACYIVAIWSTAESLAEFKKHAFDQKM